jgi:hypothetical protein
MSSLSACYLPNGNVEIHCDRATAQLIADALDVINPDKGQYEEWARECAFTLQTLLSNDRVPTH